jgi:hypothetical protein
MAPSFGQVVEFAPLDNPLDLLITSNGTLLTISITVEASKGSPEESILTYIGRVIRIVPVKRYQNKKKQETRNKKQDGDREGGQCQYRRVEAEVGEVPRQQQRHLGHQDMVPPNMSSQHCPEAGRQKTAIIVMEALREQALTWALLLQDEKPASAASWKLVQPLLLARFNKVVNETQKFKLIAALQQRQNESSKDFLDRC